MNSRIDLENKEAFVLHQNNYRDTSQIIHFFISDWGKVSAVARSVKISRKNTFSLLQPFHKVYVSLTGKNELLNLKNVESGHHNWPLSGKSLYCAYYLNELLLRLLPSHTDCTAVFHLYEQVLGLLIQYKDEDNSHFEAPLRLFELKLLDFLGYGLNLDYEINTGKAIESDKQYHYMIHSGASKMPPEESASLTISGHTLINLANCQLTDLQTLQESKQLLKWALAEHLGERPLKSRELYRQLYCS